MSTNDPKKLAKAVLLGTGLSCLTPAGPFVVATVAGLGLTGLLYWGAAKLAGLGVEAGAFGVRKLKERTVKGWQKAEPPPPPPLPPPTPAELVILAEEAYEAEIELIDGMPLSNDKKNLAKRRAERKLTARVQALLGGQKAEGEQSWPI